MSGSVKEPLVSIVMPVYNAEEYLEESLRSVMEQSYKNLEIICVDDGSTDGSAAIIKRLSEEDARIRMLSQDNSGAGAARNAGLDKALGVYVFFFDADDLLRRNAIRTLVKTAEKHITDIVLFGYYKFAGKKKIRTDFSAKTLNVPVNKVISPRDISGCLFQADHGMPWNKFYNTEFIRKTGVRFQDLKNTNDEFFSRITTTEAERILFLNKVLIRYRVGNKNSLRGNAGDSVLDCTKALYAICDELKQRGRFNIYADTFKRLAGYVIMLKLLAIDDKDAFDAFVTEVCGNALTRCGIDEDHLEEQYRDLYRALLSGDASKVQYELGRLK